MSSVMQFYFNPVKLCVVIINENPWARVRKGCKALEYNGKTANVIKAHVSPENYAHKWQLSSVACTPIIWPRWIHKNWICISMKNG